MPVALSPPNLLTFLRIGLTPFVVSALVKDQCTRALWLCLIAGFTDAIDGLLARRFGWESRFGAYLDPVADKLLLISLYLTFGSIGLVPHWLVWLVFGRDLLILAMSTAALLWTRFRNFPPTIWGKISTLLQIVTSLAILSRCAYEASVPTIVLSSLVALTAGATAWSGVHYVWRALRMAGSVRRPDVV